MGTAPIIAVKPLRGIGLKLASVVVFTAMATCIKAASAQVPPGEAVFFRSFFAIPVILAGLAWQRDLRHGLKTPNFLSHLWRGLIGTAAMLTGFAALAWLPLPEATAIGFAAPILSVILAAMFLGEKIRIYRMGAVLVGLVGVMIVLWPRMTLGTTDAVAALGAMAALTSALLRAMALIFTRKLVVRENTSAIVFYFSAIAAALGLLTIPFGWVMPDAPTATLLVVAGLCGGVGQMLLTNSYRYAPAGVIAPFDYSSMLFSLVVGWWVFGEVPTVAVLVGSVLILAAGVFIIWRESRLGLARGAAKSVTSSQG